MFTIEMDWDETSIRILDTKGNYGDLEVIIYDDITYMRQFDNDSERYSMIVVSPEMLLALNKSFELPVGAYTLKGETR
jgi:hypothetical protein